MSGLPVLEVRQRAEGVRLHDLGSKPLRLDRLVRVVDEAVAGRAEP